MMSEGKFFAGKTVVNCTDHDIVVVNEDGAEIRRLKPSGLVLRYNVTWSQDEMIDGMPATWVRGVLLDPLPPERNDIVYLVSSYYGTYAAQLGRKDFVTPGQQMISPTTHRVIGCKSINWCRDTRAVVFALPPV